MIQDKKDRPEYHLPDIVDFDSQNLDDLPERKQLIEGILHEGDSLMIGGDEYIGKSFMLMELAQALVSGGTWMGSRVEQSNVLFVNTHLKVDESYRRYMAIHKKLNAKNWKSYFVAHFLPEDKESNEAFWKKFERIVDDLGVSKDDRKFTVIVDDIDGIGFRASYEFIQGYRRLFGGNEPSLAFATCHFKNEEYVPDSVISINPFRVTEDNRKRVTAEFGFRSFHPKQPMCGVFTYPVFNWKPAVNRGDGAYSFAE